MQPTPFGRYVLRSLIARGGMAEIFLAEQTGAENFRKQVAVKRMLPHLCEESEFVSMFLDEARIASRLSHPHVVQVFDFGEVEGRYFLAMEYLAGENLTVLIKKTFGAGGTIPIPVAISVIAAVCDGLNYAHAFEENGVCLSLVHRDISPTNIVLTYQGGVKVVDFGIARALDRQQEATRAGVVKGKAPYCSPEQLRTAHVDGRSDLFSLGAVLYEVLTGKRLFWRETEMLTSFAVIHGPIPAPSEARPEISPELDRIVLKALERDRDKRYQTAMEMRRDLEKLMNGPPPRIDEYMLEVFGAEQARRRTAVQILPSSFPTPFTTSKDSMPVVQTPAGADELATVIAPIGEGDKASKGNSSTPASVDVQFTPAPRTKSSSANLRRHSSRAIPAQQSTSKKALMGAAAGAATLLLLVTVALALRPNEAKPTGQTTQQLNPQGGGETTAQTATLNIDTLPRSAELEVAGQKAPALSPVRIDGIAPGSVVVRARLEGYRDATEVVDLAAGDTKSVVLRMQKKPAKLTVKAPEKAKLVINGSERTERELELEPGEVVIQVQLAGFRSFEKKLMLGPGEEATVEAQLTAVQKFAPGKLNVSCEPWCQVFLDGQDVGKPSPIVGLVVSAGQHKLKLVHPPTGRSREVAIQVRPNQTTQESASFR